MCLALGIEDPVAWLDSTDREVIDGWEAYFRVEPWGREWEQTASTCQLLEHILASVLAYLGGKYEPQGWQAFMPVEFVGSNAKTTRKKPKQTPEQMAAMVEATFRAR